MLACVAFFINIKNVLNVSKIFVFMLSIFFYNVIISTDNTSDETLLNIDNCTPARKTSLSSQDNISNNETLSTTVSIPTCSTSKSDVKMSLLLECSCSYNYCFI